MFNFAVAEQFSQHQYIHQSDKKIVEETACVSHLIHKNSLRAVPKTHVIEAALETRCFETASSSAVTCKIN